MLQSLARYSSRLYAVESGVNYRVGEGMSTVTIAKHVQHMRSADGKKSVRFFSIDLVQKNIDAAKDLVSKEGGSVLLDHLEFGRGFSSVLMSRLSKKLPCVSYASIDAGGDPFVSLNEFEAVFSHVCEDLVISIDDSSETPTTGLNIAAALENLILCTHCCSCQS